MTEWTKLFLRIGLYLNTHSHERSMKRNEFRGSNSSKRRFYWRRRTQTRFQKHGWRSDYQTVFGYVRKRYIYMKNRLTTNDESEIRTMVYGIVMVHRLGEHAMFIMLETCRAWNAQIGGAKFLERKIIESHGHRILLVSWKGREFWHPLQWRVIHLVRCSKNVTNNQWLQMLQRLSIGYWKLHIFLLK